MQLTQFHRLRSGVQGNARPGHARDLRLVERALRAALTSSGLFEEVEVGQTDDPDRLIIALCTIGPTSSESVVAERLEQLWSDRVRYRFWEAHAIRIQEGHVEFEAASRIGPTGHYVTVHLVVQGPRVPVQRAAWN